MFFLNSQVCKTLSQFSIVQTECELFLDTAPGTQQQKNTAHQSGILLGTQAPKLIAQACGATILMRSKSFKPQISGTRD